MLKIGDEFPYRPGDAVQIDGEDDVLYVGATGWVFGKPVVWLRGKNAPIQPVPIETVRRTQSGETVV